MNEHFCIKRLLIICPTDTWGGIEKNVHLRVKAMLLRGHLVTLILLKNTFEERFQDCKGLTLITLNKRPSDLLPHIYWHYWQAMRTHQPDCVFVPLKRDWWAASLVAKLAQVPRIVLYLGIYRHIKSNIKYQLIFAHFGAQLMVNSQWLQHRAIETNRYLTESNTHLIYNGFDIPAPEPSSACTLPTNLPEKPFIIGCAGRLSRQKGFDLLPAILRQLPEHCVVLVAGEGAERSRLEADFKEAGFGKRIRLLGQLGSMNAFYQQLDLFLLPSRNEGMANVLNEAMAAGLPVISTQVPGSAELLGVTEEIKAVNGVRAGTHGLMTDTEDTRALAQAIKAIMAGKYRFGADQQRDKIAKQHSLENMMARTETLFFETHIEPECTTNQ